MEAVLIGAVMLAACLFGIQTRVLFSLASIWPANAILLGIMILRPNANRPLAWLIAGGAYVLADIGTGSSATNALVLNACNLAGVGLGLAVWRLLTTNTPHAPHPVDAILAVVVMAAASLGAALTGMIAGPMLFGMDWLASGALWFAGEFVNYALFLPIPLAILSSAPGKYRFLSRNQRHMYHQIAAASSLVLSVAVIHWIGGPSSITYLVPSLLWCSVCFRPFACAALSMTVGAWLMVAGPLGYIPLQIDMDVTGNVASYRLGVGMIAVGTFAVSVINAAWRAAHEEMQHQASHDALTGLHNRGGFMRRLSARLARKDTVPFSLLMIDVDRFKSINDTYGHPAGDAVLKELALVLTGAPGVNEVVGRVGGEEFAVIVNGGAANGRATAERILGKTRRMSVDVGRGEHLKVTVSIGVVECRPVDDISSLLSASDSALYAAKHAGRDRYVLLPTPEVPRDILKIPAE